MVYAYRALYKQLEQDGMLDVGQYGPDWYSTVFPKLKDNPTFLLHLRDVELLNTNAIAAEVGDLYDPDGYRQLNPELKFVPFATQIVQKP